MEPQTVIVIIPQSESYADSSGPWVIEFPATSETPKSPSSSAWKRLGIGFLESHSEGLLGYHKVSIRAVGLIKESLIMRGIAKVTRGTMRVLYTHSLVGVHRTLIPMYPICPKCQDRGTLKGLQ